MAKGRGSDPVTKRAQGCVMADLSEAQDCLEVG